MRVNRKYNNAVCEAMQQCSDSITENIINLLKTYFCRSPKDNHVEVVFKSPVFFLEIEKTKGIVKYTQKLADRIGVTGLNGDKKARIAVVEGPDTFFPLEWLDITTLGRVFAELLETAKAE